MSERDKKIIIKLDRVMPERVEFRCKFDDSDYNIDDMPRHSFDLVDYAELKTVEDIMKVIGKAAYMICNRQQAEENLKKTPLAKLDLNSLVGKEVSLTLGEVYE